MSPASILVVEDDDDLRQTLARRLSEAGVPTRYLDYDGMIHGFLQMDGWIADAGDLRRLVADCLA